MKHGVISEGKRFVAYVNGQVVGKAADHRGAERHFEKAVGTYVPRRAGAKSSSTSIFTPESVIEIQPNRFHVNKRFEFLNKTVKMVAKGHQASALITGPGGLGKSHSVKKALLESGLRDMTVINAESGTKMSRRNSFIIVKGYSTAKGLYRTLFENNDSVILFDDCDSVLKDPIALNILKGALDSYDTRVISWNADMRDPDLPNSFIFTGRVIFISNRNQDSIDQAIRSRSAVIDVSMTLQEIVDRMAVMIEDSEFLPQYDHKDKVAALAFIDKFKEQMKEVSLRTLITVSKVIAASDDGDWQDHAEYLTCQ